MKQNVYIIIGQYGVDCFSNLSKLIRAYRLFTYHPVYDALNTTGVYEKNNFKILKLKIR